MVGGVQRSILYYYQENKRKKILLKTQKAMGFFVLFSCLVFACLFVLKGKQKTFCKTIPLALGTETVRQELAQSSVTS